VTAKTRWGQALDVSSETAALHRTLVKAVVGSGDRVLCSTLMFVASATPILSAEPVFVDAEPRTWNIDVDLVEDELKARGHTRRAVRGADRGRPLASLGQNEVLGLVKFQAAIMLLSMYWSRTCSSRLQAVASGCR
jgi:hypothetical protein